MSQQIRSATCGVSPIWFVCLVTLVLAAECVAQEKLTTTTVASDKFVKGGKLETTSDEKLKIHSEMWVDEKGKILERHEYIYDEKGKLIRERWNFPAHDPCEKSRYPPGGGTPAPEGKWYLDCGTQRWKNATEESVAAEINTIEENIRVRLGSKPAEAEDKPAPEDKPKDETKKQDPPKEMDPGKPGYDATEPPRLTKDKPTETPPAKTNGDSSLPEPSTSAEVVQDKVPGYSATVTTPEGLFTTVMTTPTKDRVEIYLPRNLIAGETVRGSMKVIPAAPNTISIPDFFEIGLTGNIELMNGLFFAKIDNQPMTKMRLLDEKKRPVIGVDFHTQKPQELKDFSTPNPGTQLSSFYIPSSGTFGELLPARYVMDQADFLKPDGISVFIGHQPMPIIAATTHELITRIDYATPGLTEIEIKEGNTDYKRPFRVLKLDLAADSLKLLKGQSTTVHIVVHGLENLHVSAHMKIVVTGTVSMTGAFEVEIQPNDVGADGSYTTTRTLHALEAGGFGMTVTVTVEKEVQTVQSHQKGESNASL